MPRESITDQYGGTRAEIVWSADQYVQVATLSNSPAEFFAWCRNLVEAWDKFVLEAKASNPEFDPLKVKVAHVSDKHQILDVASLGMFWSPDRQEINQLIRVLRRARNAAFGADE